MFILIYQFVILRLKFVDNKLNKWLDDLFQSNSLWGEFKGAICYVLVVTILPICWLILILNIYKPETILLITQLIKLELILTPIVILPRTVKFMVMLGLNIDLRKPLSKENSK